MELHTGNARFRLFALPMLIAAAAGPRAAVAVDTESVLSRDRRVRVFRAPARGGRARPFGSADPVGALGEGDLRLFKGGLTKGEVRRLLDGYLNRIGSYCYGTHDFPAALSGFLDRNELAKEVFLSALNPRYDDIAQAARIFEELRGLDEKKLLKYVHLATAIAVVYDTPDAVESSRFYAVWGIEKSQFSELPTYRGVWDYYTDRSYAHRFGFAMDKLPWPILVHLMDNDASPQDAAWTRSRYTGKHDMRRVYKSVPYDYEKFNRKSSKLGDRPYSLPNLLKYGGICVEQAHFTTRVGKCLGVPAMKVSGKGRYGGAGHCWAGYLVIEKGRPILKFTGRYFFDYYYTGDIYDPQTRTMTLDRFVAMMYDGASLSYPKYNESQMMIRMAEKTRAEHPAESLALTQEALKLNYFNMWGWPLLMQHIKRGTLDEKQGLKWFNTMLTALKDHPDMTFECLGDFLDCLPGGKVAQRQSLYDQASRLYEARPDLLLKLRMAQTEELVAAGEKLRALNVLVPTIVKNSKEGTLVLPAMRTAVKLAKEFGVERQAYPTLKKAEREFPKQRGTRPSAAYAEFKKLLELLR